MNLAHRTINNALFNTAGWALPLGLSFLLIPYIVSKMGPDLYGILTLVLTIIGYFALLDLGLGSAMIKFVAEYNAQGDAKKLNQTVGAALLMFVVLGLFGGMVIALSANLLVTRIMKIPPQLVRVAYLTFCLGSLGFFLTMSLSACSAIPAGLNRYDVTSMMTLASGTCTMVGTATLLALGFGILHVVLLNLFISLVGIAVYAMIIKRLMPSINLMPVFNWAATKKVLGFGLYSVLSRIAYLANYQADRLVTATILGVSWVTYYAVPFMIINRLTSVTVTLGTVIFPAISELQGRNRFDTITDLYLVSYRVIIVLSTALCLPLLVFGGRLLALWMGVDFGQKAGIAIALITIGLYVNSFTNVPSFVADGLGRPKINGLSSLCHAVLNVGLAIPLARRFGITGVALAFLGSNVLVAPLFIWYVNGRLLHLSLGKLLLKVYLKPLAAGACLLSVLAAVPVHRVYTLPVLLSLFSASSFLYLGACYLGGVLPGREKLLIREYARIAIWRLAAVLHGSR